MTQETKDTLYYDSDCPICSAEMEKLARVKHQSLELTPITQADVDEEARQALYHILHIRRADGQWLTGFDANLYAWSKTKYAKLAWLFNFPPLLWLGRLGYRLWLQYYHYSRKKREKKG